MKNLLIGLVCVFILSCTSKTNSLPQLTKVEFNVDTTLLHLQKFTDSAVGLSVGIPKLYSTMSEVDLSQIQENLLKDHYHNSNLMSGYSNLNDSSLMLIVNVSQMDALYFDSLSIYYPAMLNANKIWMDIQYQKFRIGDIPIHQYVLQNESHVSFKVIVFEDDKFRKPKIELLYLINRSKFIDNIKSVESSIGSIS